MYAPASTARIPITTPASKTCKADAAPASPLGSGEFVDPEPPPRESEVLSGEEVEVGDRVEGRVSVPGDSLEPGDVAEGVSEGWGSEPEGDPEVGVGAGD
jgi:hypothetical protein